MMVEFFCKRLNAKCSGYPLCTSRGRHGKIFERYQLLGVTLAENLTSGNKGGVKFTVNARPKRKQ